MHPTDLRWNITPILVMVLGLIVALFLGVFIGGSEVTNLGVFFGLIGIIALVSSMRQHIWLLCPFSGDLPGTVTLLPIPFAVRDLIVMLVAGVSLALFALRVFKFKNQMGFFGHDLHCLNLPRSRLVFIFNPVGLKVSLLTPSGHDRTSIQRSPRSLILFYLINRYLRSWHDDSDLVIIAEPCSSALFLLIARATVDRLRLGQIYDGFLPPAYPYGLTRCFRANDRGGARRNITDNGFMFIFSAT